MEIENKLDESRIVTIEKEPEVGDLVAHKFHCNTQAWGARLETGLVLETWSDKGPFEDEVFPQALVYWGETEDEETFPLDDLEVISS